ncbi:MAG: tetratricopeptide repeat protein [Brevinematia bacterium]
MDRVNLVPNINSNVVSNLVPEANNSKNSNNQYSSKEQGVQEVIVDINKEQNNNKQEIKTMASTYEKIGDAYEKMSRLESAITAYQTSYSIKPDSNVVQKIDDLAVRLSKDGKV